MKTLLSNDIELTAYRASYDRCCKNLLIHRKILAYILKECVTEFKEYDVDYIAENCIEDSPEVSEVAVHRTGHPEKITGLNTEDKTIDEGTVFYDIRFVACLPKTGETIRLIINLEAQNSYHPGYSIVKRGLYYCCRLISAQYGTEFTEDHYDDIKKVYSIWICTNTPKYARNTITRYCMTEENIVGNLKENIKNYDLLNVIMVCLDKDSDEIIKTGGILKLLRILLSDVVNPTKKKLVLNDDFGIKPNVEFDKELSDMCNLSAGVLEKGWNQGMEKGIEKGIEKGRKDGKEESKLEDIKNLMEGAGFSFEKAVSILKIPENEWEKYRSKL